MTPDPLGDQQLPSLTREALREKALQAKKLLPQTIDQLLAAIKLTHPLVVLSNLCGYGSIVLIGRDDYDNRFVISQHLMELAQAFYLMVPEDGFEPSERLFKPINEVEALLRSLSDQYAESFLSTPLDSLDEVEVRQTAMAATMRQHTHVIRNLGYPQHVSALATGLYGQLDAEIENCFGLSATAISHLLDAIRLLLQRRLKVVFQVKVRLSRATSLDELKRLAERFVGFLPGDPRDLLHELQSRGDDLDQIKLGVIQFVDATELPSAASFGIDEAKRFASASTSEALRRILDEWTMDFGALRDADPLRTLIQNPVWDKPFVRLGDRYFCPIPNLLYSFRLRMLDVLVEQCPAAQKKYEVARPRYLERQVAEVMRNALPGADRWPNSEWTDAGSGITYENDLTVRLDRYVLVIEAKSGRIRDAARRGGVDSLKQATRKLLDDPAEQALRFARLLANRATHSFKQRGTSQHNDISMDGVTDIICLGVVLEELHTLATASRRRMSAGLVGAGAESIVAMNLIDLQMISELLPSPSSFLHYLCRRAVYERDRDFIADESDLLAYYINDPMNFHLRPPPDTVWTMYGRSEELDSYYDGRKSRPAQLPIHAGWASIIARVEQARFPGWVPACLFLMDVDSDTQKRVLAGIDEAVAEVWRNGIGAGGHSGISIGADRKWKNASLVALTYSGVALRDVSRLLRDCVRHEIVVERRAEVLAIAIGVKVVGREFTHFLHVEADDGRNGSRPRIIAEGRDQ